MAEPGEKSQHRQVLAVAVFKDEEKATRLVEDLVDEDFPMDRISLLKKASGLGDDMLGVSYSNTEQRMKVWGMHGAVWGALWGLLASAAGFFVVPGLGGLLAAGPVVEALGSAVAGAAVAGGAMAGAAAVTQLASALHRIGIPEEHLEHLHDAVEQGHHLLILHCKPGQQEEYVDRLRQAGADEVLELPVRY